MKIFDCHCDTLLKMYSFKKGFYQNGFEWDMSHISNGDKAEVVYAIYNDGSIDRNGMTDIIKYFHTLNSKGNTAHLSIEGLGNQSDFEISDIELYAKMGVRMMSLTWSGDNILSGGIGKNALGLTELGFKAICEMNRLNVIADISHISDKGAYEVIESSKTPVCASHSNSRYIYNVNRNLTDELIRLVSQSGGVIGVNFYSEFVSKEGDIDSLLKHIDHIVKIGGESCVGIGSDFDGADKMVTGLENAKGFYRLYDTMLTKKYSETFINQLLFGNFGELFKKYELLV